MYPGFYTAGNGPSLARHGVYMWCKQDILRSAFSYYEGACALTMFNQRQWMLTGTEASDKQCSEDYKATRLKESY